MTEPTGERFIPEVWGTEFMGAEHYARYRLATQLAEGRTVLDAGCGVGWGTAMLLDAGARSATGVDISVEAIADSRAREPRGALIVADLRCLPLAARRFDLITCFEAIEHVEDPLRALDELARLLAPGGILLVSSPNPRVYPPGNPYHVHEFTPEELCDELQARFSSVALWRQLGLVASVLVEDRPSWAPGHEIPLVGGSVVAEPAGQDPYSVAIATNGEQPDLTAVSMFAPAQELPHLAEVRESLERERFAMMNEVDLAHRERERVAALLLHAEQRVATLIPANRRLEAQIADMHSSRSWRATAWMRSVSRAARRG